MIDVRGFYVFWFREVLYVYWKRENVLKWDCVIVKKELGWRKEVGDVMIVVVFVVKYMVCGIIVGGVVYLLNEEEG